MSPRSCPSLRVISSHPGYSRSAAFTVKSQRPRNGCMAAASVAERSFENALAVTTVKKEVARRTIAGIPGNLVIQTPYLRNNAFKLQMRECLQAQNVVVFASVGCQTVFVRR